MTHATSGDSSRVRVATATAQKGAMTIVELDVSVSLDGTSRLSMESDGGGVALHRVRSALQAALLPFPPGRVVVTVSEPVTVFDPAFDLALAIGLLVVQGIVPSDVITDIVAVGELGLDGQIQSCRGVFPLAVVAACRKPRPIVLVPAPNSQEAALVDRTHCVAVAHLSEVVSVLAGTAYRPKADLVDLSDIEGMAAAKRALAIAAAGGHHVLLMGPPSTGKTMLARRLPGLLPPLSREEALEVTGIYSIAGLLPSGASYLATRPFRAPHHTGSEAAMFGRGRHGYFRPGEVSLAHRGVLFLDEATEFHRHVLYGVSMLLSGIANVGPEGLRADVLCMAAMTPCPCGWYGAETVRCHNLVRKCCCTPEQVRSHRQRLVPLLEHLDLKIDLSADRQETGEAPRSSESSEVIRTRVAAARERQRRDGRFATGPKSHTRANTTRLLSACSPEALGMLGVDRDPAAMESLAVLRVARTIADLEESDQIQVNHLVEAETLHALWW